MDSFLIFTLTRCTSTYTLHMCIYTVSYFMKSCVLALPAHSSLRKPRELKNNGGRYRSSFLALLRPPESTSYPTGQFSSVLFLVSNSFLLYCWRLACGWRFPGQLQFPDALTESQLSTGQLKEIALVCAVQAL